MRKFTIAQTSTGEWAAFDVRGKIISGPHAEQWMASLYGTHAACAPSQVKRLNLRKVDGVLQGRPFGGVHVKALFKQHSGEWRSVVEVDGNLINYIHDTRKGVLDLIEAHGRDIMKTRNILNPEAGEIDIERRDWGGCTDPGTERYHCM